MKRTIFRLALLACVGVFGSCNTTDNPLDTANGGYAMNETKDGVQYTFSVSKRNLDITDTLIMTVTAKNETDAPQVLRASDYDFKWTLTNSQGAVIAFGPTLFSNLIRTYTLKPGQSITLYDVSSTVADIFGSPIQTGSYPLTWELSNGLSFQINLTCEGQTEGPGVSSPIYPLKVGNRWIFLKVYSYHGTTLGTDTVTETIVGQKEVRDETWYLLKSTDFVDEYITARQDGIYKYFTDLDTAVLLYKYPAMMGDSYISGYDSYTGYDDKDTVLALPMRVDSTNELLSVPAGQYQCYKYTQPEKSSTSGGVTTIIPSQEAYLSSIGPVARGDAGGSIYEELISVILK